MVDYQTHIKELELTHKNLSNKLWRLENLYPIRNKNGIFVPLKFNDQQKIVANRLREKIEQKDFSPIVILKARQVGISTMFCIWFLDDVLFESGIQAIIQSQKRETMHDIHRICRQALQFMPDKLNFIRNHTEDKQGKISKPSTGSFIESKLEARSISSNRIHFSEVGFMKREHLLATVGSIANNGIKIYESTANGFNHFREFYYDQKEQNPNNVFFFAWHDHWDYRQTLSPDGLGQLDQDEQKGRKLYKWDDEQIEWRRKKIQEFRFLDDEHKSFDQEFPANDHECFLSTGAGVIESQYLVELEMQCNKAKPIELIQDGKLKIKIFKVPTFKEIKDRMIMFYCGVDPAEGVNRDYTVAIVLAIDTQGENIGQTEVVMTMRGFENPVDLCPKLERYLNKYYARYNEQRKITYQPRLVIERNNHGHAVLALMRRIYKNIYKHKNPVSEKMDKAFSPGFLTTSSNRTIILGNVFNLIRERKIIMNDPVIASEFRTLILNENHKIEADQGKHDDTIMALCLAYQGFKARPITPDYQYPHFAQ